VSGAASQPIAFLGPEGTFTEEALLANLPAGEYHPFPYPSIRDVLTAVQAGEAPLGIVPIENSIEGSVVVTLDSLAFGFDELRIVREITWQVHQQLIARRPVDFERVTKDRQHPARLRPVPRVHPRAPRRSRARAHRLDRRSGTPRESRRAAVGGHRHPPRGRDVRVRGDRPDIDDATDNRTRFVFVSRDEAPQGEPAEGAGGIDAAFKTSIVCGISQDQPGSLLMILSEFAYRYVNLTKVESRPSKQGLGDYIFFIDMVGRATDQPIAKRSPALAASSPGSRCWAPTPPERRAAPMAGLNPFRRHMLVLRLDAGGLLEAFLVAA